MLDAAGTALPIRRLAYDCIDSTNAEAWRLVEAGTANPQELTVLTARQQTAGRGQFGRQWLSLPGGLYLTALLQPSMPAAIAPQIALWSAWGIASTLQALVPTLRLKWPNDLVVAGKKLGGILVETRLMGDRVAWAAVGAGIDVTNPVPDVGITLADVVAPSLDLDALADRVVAGILSGYARFLREGIAPLLRDYANLLGDRRVAWHGQQGTIVGVSAAGELEVVWDNESVIARYCPGSIALGYATEVRS